MMQRMAALITVNIFAMQYTQKKTLENPTIPRYRGVHGIIPGLKNPGTKNPGILISEISRDKKSRDFCYLKIPGFFDNIPGYPVGFYFEFFTHFID